MKTKNNTHKLTTSLRLALTLSFIASGGVLESQAGLKKWFKKEAVPTLQGKRNDRIHLDRVTIQSNDKKYLEVNRSNNSAFLRTGPVTWQTGHFDQRMAQAAEVGAHLSYGNVGAAAGTVARAQFERQRQMYMQRMMNRYVPPRINHYYRQAQPYYNGYQSFRRW